MEQIEISVIIPHKDSLDCLPRLLNSIQLSETIEIIVVDNSPIPISRDDIKTDRKLHSINCICVRKILYLFHRVFTDHTKSLHIFPLRCS